MPVDVNLTITDWSSLLSTLIGPYTTILGSLFILFITLLVTTIVYIYSKNIMTVSIILIAIGSTTTFTGQLGLIPYMITAIGITIFFYKLVVR